MRGMLRILLLAAILVAPSMVRADWVERKATGNDDYLWAVGRDGVGALYVGGLMMSTAGGGLPSFAPVLKRSLDDGQTWADLVAYPNLGLAAGGFDVSPIMDLHFLAQWYGWVILGQNIAYQEKLGVWKKVKLDAMPQQLHMFDAQRGIACGDGGSVWRTEDGGRNWSPVVPGDGSQADFGTLQCFSNGRCFMAGQVSEVIELEQGNQVRYKNWEFWSTTNHGRTWTRGHTETPAEEDGQLVGPLFFLPDAMTGFLVVSDWDTANNRARMARVLKTTDGGYAFHDMKVATEVGTFKSFIGNLPIHLNHVAAMHWQDASRGRLVGSAFVTSVSGGQGGDTKIYRRADFSTTDGGKTWTRPNLGTLEMDMTNPNGLPSEPRPLAGHFESWVQGVVVGEGGRVWQWQLDCVKHSDCGAGFQCDRETLVCVPAPVQPGEDACATCGDTGTGDRDAVEPGEDAPPPQDVIGADVRIPMEGGGDGGNGGCGAGTGQASPGAMVLILGLGLGWLAVVARRGRARRAS